MQSVRMSDVAKAAGVSTMTVSRVLNGNQSVHEDTRRKVFAAIDRLGYRRNELARSLRDRRSRQIGILVPNLYDPFFALCTHAINAVAKLHSYAVSTATTDQDPEIEFEEASRMLQRSVEGLVVIPSGLDQHSKLLGPEFEGMPIVTMDRPASGAGRKLDSLVVQNKRGGQLGTEHLLSLGHKRVACITLNPRLYTLRMRREGYLDAMHAAGLTPEVIEVPEGLDATVEALRVLLRTYQPTALFCANNVVSRQVLHGLQQLNIQPPTPIALTGFDDFEFADILGRGVTVVRQPVESLAKLAAEVLFERLAETRPQPIGKRIVLPVELVIRGSCGAQAS